ncbi:MAG: FecR family protein [bacterium]
MTCKMLAGVMLYLFRPLLILSFLFCGTGVLSRAAQITDVSGKAEIRRSGKDGWRRIDGPGAIWPGDSLKTGWRGKVRMYLDDGSRVELGPSSSFSIDADGGGKTDTVMKLAVGWMKAWVRKLAKRKFDVRTPTAVCSVRGTEFAVGVEGGKTSIDLLSGLLAVADNKGNETLLKDGQHVSVDEAGIGQVQSLESARATQKEESHAQLKNEVSLNMTKEQVMAAASEEMKLSEYQQGKSMIDVFGKRVRLEQYIMRPAADQFKLVVLNDRLDRFDYFFYKGTFNTALPTDLSVALGQLGGCAGAACDYFLTGYETGRSNLTDTVQELASDGHLVDINNNAVTNDDITSYFDSSLNKYISVTGSYWKTLFDNYSIKYNGIAFNTWEPNIGVTPYDGNIGTGIQAYFNNDGTELDALHKYIGDDGTLGTTIPGQNSDRNPDGDVLHDKIKLTYGSGDYWEQYDNYIVNDEGEVAVISDFAGDRTGTSYKETLLKWNFEQAVTCSLFGGRKIDLVIEPKTLIQSGLIR